MKRTLAFLAVVALAVGCKKDDYITLNDSDESYVTFAENSNGNDDFNVINYVPDGAADEEYISLDDFHVVAKLAGPRVAPEDVIITYSIDAAAVAKFNADGLAADPDFKPYAVLPDSTFDILVATDTIKKGEVYAEKTLDNIITFPTKIDPSQFYLIPLKVTSTQYESAPGSSTILFYIIGNPLAGNYSDIGIRYNYTGSVAWTMPAPGLALSTAPDVPSANPPAGGTVQTTYNGVKAAVPVNGQTVVIDYGNVPEPVSGALAQYIVTADATFATITYDFSTLFKGGYSNIQKYQSSYTPPAPGVKPTFRFVSKYNNAVGGAGSDRFIDESFRHL